MKKKLVVAATAGALAMAAGQAFALENIFNGSFALRGINSNYATGSAGYLLSPVTGEGVGKVDSKNTNNFIEQRTRLFYTAKANDNLKFVAGFELDSTWGKSSYIVGRGNDGGAVGADTVNLETKNAYLDFNCPITGANVKAGIMPYVDAYKGIFINADAAGLQISKGVGPATIGFGWFRLDDRDVTYPSVAASGTDAASLYASPTANALGKKTRDLLILDGKFNVNKDVKVGGSYYFLNADNNIQSVNAQTTTSSSTYAFPKAEVFDVQLHALGVNASANVGPATIDGFFLYEFGREANGTVAGGNEASEHINSFAANVAAKIKAGPGNVKVAGLYVNGGANRFFSINNTTSGSYAENTGGAAGDTVLLFRNPGSTSNDQSLVYESGFMGMGVAGVSAGYDANITEKAFAKANIGMAWAAKNPDAVYGTGTAKSKYIGTELNTTIGYKLFDNLTASTELAYVFLGGFYDAKGRAKADGTASDPANPYTARINLTYAF